MAKTRLSGKLGGEKLEHIEEALARVDGVRSVRAFDGAIEVEYDETLVGENKIIEISNRHGEGRAVPPTAAPSTTGMDPTR